MTCLLLPNARLNLKNHLLAVESFYKTGVKSKPIRIQIAELTLVQFVQLNEKRSATNRPKLNTQLIEYDGRHHYKSRRDQGYTIDDMIDQIVSALDSDSIVEQIGHYVNLVNPNKRNDSYGKLVNDAAAFNVDTRWQNAELFSVIPKGDGR